MTERRTDSQPADPDALLAKIRQAEGKTAQPVTNSSAGDGQGSDLAKKAGIDFGATVLGGTLLGLVLDYSFGWLPWGTVGFMLGGFVVGLVNIWRVLSTQKQD